MEQHLWRCERARPVTLPSVELKGHCAPDLEPVRAAFQSNFDRGLEDGASVAVSVAGEIVVDLWGGHRNEARDPWESDTLVNLYSTSKTMTALALLVLADNGQVDLEAPVARYWPEFADNGKGAVTICQVLGHTAGLPGWDQPVVEADLYDWEKVTSLLAAQAPWWTPGTASGYHAVTQGYLLGEVVRRVTGKSFGQYFRDSIAEPIGADFYFASPPEVDARIARLVPTETRPGDRATSGMASRVFRNPYERAEWSWSEAFRRADIPACNGLGNARSIAQLQSVLVCEGQSNGRRLLSAEGCLAALSQQSSGADLVVGADLRFGLGYGLGEDPGRRVCYWGGWGGSMVWLDFDRQMVVAYAMNRMSDGSFIGDRTRALIGAATKQVRPKVRSA